MGAKSVQEGGEQGGEVKTPFCLLEAPSLFSRFKPWIVPVLRKVSHPRSVSWAFRPWAATIPARPTPLFCFFVYTTSQERKACFLGRERLQYAIHLVLNSGKTDWLCLLFTQFKFSIQEIQVPCVEIGSISDFRDTPFQALPVSQTSEQDEVAGSCWCRELP